MTQNPDYAAHQYLLLLLLFHSPDFQLTEVAVEPRMLEAAQTQAAGKNSSDIKYISGFSNTGELIPTVEYGKTDAKVKLSSGKRYS